MTYRRKLSPVERIHAACGRSPFTLEVPRVAALVIEGDGELDPTRLEHALEQASRANPGTRVRLRGHLARARWEERAASAPALRVVRGAAWSGWSSDGAEVLDGPLSLRDGPTWELVLLPGAPCRLVLRALHAATDGRGLLLFAREVLAALRGERLVGHAATATDVDVLARLRGGTLSFAQGRWLQPTGAPAGDERGDVWRRVHLPGRHSRLFGRVALAAARAAWRHGPGEVRFAVPVDLRQHVPELRTLANMVGLAFLTVPRDATAETVEAALAREIELRNHAALPRGAALVSLVPLRFLDFGLGRRPRTYRTAHLAKNSGMISNLGRVALSELSAPGFAARAAFPLPIPDNFFVALAGDEHGAHLTVGVPRLFATDGRLEELCRFLAAEVLGSGPEAASGGQRGGP